MPRLKPRQSRGGGKGLFDMPPDASDMIARINIRPGARILGALRFLNYRPWFALAEFVDNALQSFLTNRERIGGITGVQQSRVTVSIEAESNAPARIAIRDDAAGISTADFPRAFRPAEVPPDASGLGEYGMGMKSAACWFAPRWHVRTSALGEPFERLVRLDIACIVQGNIEELDVQVASCPAGAHFTEVVLEEPYNPLTGRTLGKVKEHLADIYRCYLREGSLALRVNGQPLTYEEPEVLCAPFYREPKSGPVTWKKFHRPGSGRGAACAWICRTPARREGRARGLRPVPPQPAHTGQW